MQAQINDFAANAHPTPAKSDRSPVKLTQKMQQEVQSSRAAGHETAVLQTEEDTANWQRGLPEQESHDSGDYIDELDLSDPAYEAAAVKIQRQARVMIARNNFRVNLYKLILLKNIIDTKVHKEKMQMLFAFEQLIINTEDPEEDAA